MRIEQLGAKDLIGYGIVTKNKDEQSPETAKIGGLWNTFFTEIYKQELNGDTIYGLYSNYASGQDGSYLLTVAVEKGSNTSKRDDIREVKLEAGRYAVFSGQRGEGNPVLELWKEAWAYFAEKGSQNERLFTTDVEMFHPDGRIDLCIAIKD